jgi:LPS export ABC transporter protein LptC
VGRLKLKKNYIFLALYSLGLFVVGICLGSLFSGVMTSENTDKLLTPSPEPTVQESTVEVEQFNYETSFEKGKKWKLYADSVGMGEKTKIARIKGVSCSFYENDKKRLTVKSKEGVVDIPNKNVSFENKVMAEATEGATFEVNKLYWDGTQKKLSGEGNVMFTRDNSVARADKINVDVNLNTCLMEGNVLLIKKLDQEGVK